jgi:mRNA interferase RelE/StbE
VYEIIIAPRALKQLEKLPTDVQDRIFGALERIKIRPEAHVKKLVGSHLYRLRVGDYRVIIDLERTELRILVIRIGHRKNIYGRKTNL